MSSLAQVLAHVKVVNTRPNHSLHRPVYNSVTYAMAGTAPFILDQVNLNLFLLELVSAMVELQVSTQLAQSIPTVLPVKLHILARQSSKEHLKPR